MMVKSSNLVPRNAYVISESSQPFDPESVATIIRMTGGNFRLLNRLLNQMERILEIKALREVTKVVPPTFQA